MEPTEGTVLTDQSQCALSQPIHLREASAVQVRLKGISEFLLVLINSGVCGFQGYLEVNIKVRDWNSDVKRDLNVIQQY
jgi:hypothetical protein